MAIDAKMSFIKQLETRLSNMLTVDAMSKLLSTVHDVMEGYKMEEVYGEEEQEDLLTCYIEALRVQGRSEKTIRVYSGTIKKMLASVKAPIRRITVYHLRSYIAKMKAEGTKTAHWREKDRYFPHFSDGYRGNHSLKRIQLSIWDQLRFPRL